MRVSVALLLPKLIGEDGIFMRKFVPGPAQLFYYL